MLERFAAELNFMGLELSNEQELISEHSSFLESKAFESTINVFKKSIKVWWTRGLAYVTIRKGINEGGRIIACDGKFAAGFEVGVTRNEICIYYENLSEYVFETYSENYVNGFYDSMSRINKIGIDISGAHHAFLSSYLALQIFRKLDENCVVSLNSVDYSDIEEILGSASSENLGLEYSDNFVALVIDLSGKNGIKSKQVFYAATAFLPF